MKTLKPHELTDNVTVVRIDGVVQETEKAVQVLADDYKYWIPKKACAIIQRTRKGEVLEELLILQSWFDSPIKTAIAHNGQDIHCRYDVTRDKLIERTGYKIPNE